MTIHEVPIDSITVGERRREEMGDIEGLAASIAEYGLLHPITITRERVLVTGGRRLRAYQLLGKSQIPARIREDLSGAALREVELEENLQRKDLTPYERSRTLVELAPLVAARISSESEEKDARGRKSTYSAPKEAIAEALGVGVARLVEAEQHVTTADAFPVFRQPQWNQATVLEARKVLCRLPEEDRGKAVAFVDDPTIPTTHAIGMLETLAEMPPEQREKVFTLGASEDRRDRELASTTAARLVPHPDPRTVWLRGVIRDGRQWVRQFADDPLTPRYTTAMDDLQSLADETARRHKERIEHAI